MNDFQKLPAFKLQHEIRLAGSEPESRPAITANSPATRAMTDFTRIRPATIRPSASLSEAGLSMNHQNVQLLFVVEDTPLITGLITSSDLHGIKPMRVIQALNIRYNELTVDNVMTRLENLDAIDYEHLLRASIGDAITTMQRFGRNHLLVVDRETRESPHRVRGLISRSEIERLLGRRIEISRLPRSFAEIEQAMMHGDDL